MQPGTNPRPCGLRRRNKASPKKSSIVLTSGRVRAYNLSTPYFRRLTLCAQGLVSWRFCFAPSLSFSARSGPRPSAAASPILPAPSYRVTFEATGFKRAVRDNVELRVGDVLPVDISLQVGNVAESVEVTAATQL